MRRTALSTRWLCCSSEGQHGKIGWQESQEIQQMELPGLVVGGGITACSSAGWDWPSGKQLCREGLGGPGEPWASYALFHKGSPTVSPWVHQEQRYITCKLGMWSFSPPLHWGGYSWSAESSLGLPGIRGAWMYWRETRKGPQKCWGAWSVWVTWRGWESWDCSAWRGEGSEGSSSCVWTTDGLKKVEPGSSEWCPMTGQEVIGTNWDGGDFDHPIRKNFNFSYCEGSQTLGYVGWLWSIHPWRYLTSNMALSNVLWLTLLRGGQLD